MNAPLPSPTAWAAQLNIGRYTLLTELARGGMAELWLANQAGPAGFEKVVVVKKILTSDDDSFLTMFLDEARIASQLSHPNIVQIFELGSYEGSYFIAMEYLHGESIQRILQQSLRSKKPLPFAYSARLIANVADALEHAHTKTTRDGQPLVIVHRDISPQNLLVTYDGVVKVVDFGIAKAAIRDSETQDGVVKGKFGYMPPEQARGEPVDAQSDIFALGAVLFEMLTGQRRVKIQDQLKAFHELTSPQPLQRPRERNPEVPLELDAIVAKAMSKDRADRFGSMRQMQVALEQWLRQQPQACSNADIERYMVELFAENIAQRTAAIDEAIKRASGLNTTAVKARRTLAVRRTSAAIVGGALLLGLIAGGIVALSRVEKGKSPAASAVTTKPAREPTQVTIETDPEGATVSVDEVVRGLSPLTLKGLSVGTHEISTELIGRRDAKQVVRLESEGQQVKIVLPLLPVEVDVPRPSNAVAPVQVTGSGPAPGVWASSKGRLTLDTVPWTRVFMGKQLLGETPLIDITVPSGLKTFRLVNEGKGIDQTIEVQVKPGQLTVKKLSL